MIDETKNGTENNKLLALARSLLNFIVYACHVNLNQQQLGHFKKQVKEKLAEFYQQALIASLPEATINDAAYAAVALVDEIILASKLGIESEWQANPLQLEYFKEHLAGKGFFNRLQSIYKCGREQIDLLELYYVCLQLGFEGEYKLQNPDKLLTLQLEIYQAIKVWRSAENISMTQVATSQCNRNSGRIISIRTTLIAGVFLWVLTYITFFAASKHQMHLFHLQIQNLLSV